MLSSHHVACRLRANWAAVLQPGATNPACSTEEEPTGCELPSFLILTGRHISSQSQSQVYDLRKY